MTDTGPAPVGLPDPKKLRAKPPQILRVRGTEKRKRVLDAAAAIFARNGYHGIGTREIAESLGIKVASLYFHLASKEDALAEICQHGIVLSLSYLRDAVHESDTLESFIRCFFRLQREGFLQHSDYVTVYLRELRHLSDEAKKQIILLSREFRIELDQAFTQFAAAHELHPSLTPRAARFIMLGTIRNISQLYADRSIRDLDAVMADCVEALIRGLRA